MDDVGFNSDKELKDMMNNKEIWKKTFIANKIVMNQIFGLKNKTKMMDTIFLGVIICAKGDISRQSRVEVARRNTRKSVNRLR